MVWPLTVQAWTVATAAQGRRFDADPSVVGARELKTRLGQYLNRVRLGETLLVTDRNEPIAELRPITGAATPVAASLRKLAAGGAVTLPLRTRVTPFVAIRLRGAGRTPAADAVGDDREDRG